MHAILSEIATTAKQMLIIVNGRKLIAPSYVTCVALGAIVELGGGSRAVGFQEYDLCP